MSEETPSSSPPAGRVPRDRAAEAQGRERRRRRGIAIAAAVVLVAGVGIGQLTTGFVSRALDATGLFCGGEGWDRIADDELADMRILRWGTPEAREQNVDPADFVDLPPGLAQPTLTTAIGDAGYDPLLRPIDGSVVLQSAGYFEQTWVAADIETGDPLWGVSTQETGISVVQGLVGLVGGREDGRTDLTTLDPRTGEKLSCAVLGGSVLDIAAVGEHDLVIALDVPTGTQDDDEESDQSTYRLIRFDPTTGETAWTSVIDFYPGVLEAEGDLVIASSHQPGGIATQWIGDRDTVVSAFDADSGAHVWSRRPDGGATAVLGTVTLADGDAGTLTLDIPDQQSFRDRTGAYTLLDSAGEVAWSSAASDINDQLGMWATDDIVIVLEDYHPVALDLRTGERLWRAEGGGMEDDMAVLEVDGRSMLVVSDQKQDDEFSTLVIDLPSGEATTFEVPMRSFELTDSYVLTSTGQTQIVIPLES